MAATAGTAAPPVASASATVIGKCVKLVKEMAMEKKYVRVVAVAAGIAVVAWTCMDQSRAGVTG